MPPPEVYERPATEFVASFVGTSNVIEAPYGRAVLRPEKIEISIGPPRRWTNRRRGTYRVDVAYLGMVTRFTVRLDDGTTMTVARQNSPAAQNDSPSHPRVR